ncbi:hypothetical protein KFL_011630030 [Klebsormidium nitens]|uniref:Uncharacterized protein n=1 Tax=Klebsormidium nitens TaxID=105231 RepID=A0A1Y1IU16_KLENI|nr:hypothetical protein KFL_011630030 [Klebsormidium nitens]|eukprot:GAQ92841.1 hypothetical protein KFL_011630030 [Klebsormidium nitens]
MAFCAECWKPIGAQPTVACRRCAVSFHRTCLRLTDPQLTSQEWWCGSDAICQRSRFDRQSCVTNEENREALKNRGDSSFRTDWDKLLPSGNYVNGTWASRLKQCIEAGGDFRYEVAPIVGTRGQLCKKKLPVPAEYLSCKWDPRKGYVGDESLTRAHQETVAELRDFTKMRSHLAFLAKLKYRVPLEELRELVDWISGLSGMAGDLKVYDSTVGDANGIGKVVYVSRGRDVLRAATATRVGAVPPVDGHQRKRMTTEAVDPFPGTDVPGTAHTGARNDDFQAKYIAMLEAIFEDGRKRNENERKRVRVCLDLAQDCLSRGDSKGAQAYEARAQSISTLSQLAGVAGPDIPTPLPGLSPGAAKPGDESP